MQARAIAKHIRISPKKARPVADLVRDKQLSEAYNILEHTHKKATEPLRKAIHSAESNLKDQDPVAQTDDMKIEELRVDEGPTLQRWQPRAMGRASEIRKRSSHIKVVVSTDETEAE